MKLLGEKAEVQNWLILLEFVYSSLASLESVDSFTFQKYAPQSLPLKGYVREKNKINS